MSLSQHLPLWLFLVFGAIGLAGLLLLLLSHSTRLKDPVTERRKWWSLVMQSIGIFLLFNLTVTLYVFISTGKRAQNERENFVTEARENFLFLIRDRKPSPIWYFLEDMITIHQSYEISREMMLSFADIDPGDSCIEINAKLKRTIYNPNSFDISQRVRLEYFVSKWDCASVKPVNLSFDGPGVSDTFAFKIDGITKDTVLLDTTLSILSRDSVASTYDFSMLLSRRDYYCHVVKAPIEEGLTFTVSKLPGYQYKFLFFHPKDGDPAVCRIDSAGNALVGRIKNPVLPGNGILVEWHPIPSIGPSAE